jgi:hypothetical protein
MANPYAAEFETGNVERLVGEITFTDPANQPGPLEVTDGVHPVAPTTTIAFTDGALVTDGGSGLAQVSIRPLVTVNAGAPSPLTTFVTALFFDSTAVTGGLYAWTGTTYTKVGLATT